jgi:hypothetical protein
MPEEVSETQVITQKETLLGIGMGLIAGGAAALDRGAYLHGAILIAAGFTVLYLRGYFKFHHWHKANGFWRGRPAGR